MLEAEGSYVIAAFFKEGQTTAFQVFWDIASTIFIY